MADLEIQHAQPLASNPAESSQSWRLFWQRVLSPAAVAVYLALRQRPGQTVDAYYFAASLGLNERELAAAMLKLQEHGFIHTGDK